MHNCLFIVRQLKEHFAIVRSVDYSIASIRKAGAQAACSKLNHNQHTGWLHKSNTNNNNNQYRTDHTYQTYTINIRQYTSNHDIITPDKSSPGLRVILL